ncbi:TPA: acetoacetate--CoA ligase [Pseudomonas aeruginosa]|nr:acetoacetate--CoA ligase [Pseudomonas aeruginosa]
MSIANEPPLPIWRPDVERCAQARIGHYQRWVEMRQGRTFDDYQALWEWSTSDIEAFWRSIWDYFEIHSPDEPSITLAERCMPGAQWFPGTRVNYTRQVFRQARGEQPALIVGDEGGALRTLSWRELERQVASLAAALRRFGVRPGDRVGAWLPNREECVVAFLACASVGAIWSLCSPDMGAASVLDRFRQIEPKVLIACDGYRYGGRCYPRQDVLAELVTGLPSLEWVVKVSLLGGVDAESPAILQAALPWAELVAEEVELETVWLPFEHPLWIVYSSGTTGVPKPIVHGHGGILLAMTAMLALHNDLGPDDRYHWYSSTSWIMWNCQVSGLLVGSTLCLFDGNPGTPDMGALWRFAGQAGATFFGAGAAYYAACLKAAIEPRELADLSALRAIGSTGSPLSPECYQWIYDHVGADLWLTPMSGGTDLAGPFIAGNPTMPVYLGEMQCRVLGAAVQAFGDSGQALIDEVGELVCTQPMPSMPLYFWNDPGDQRYLDSYFDTWPGIWRHGDWVRITPRGGAVIYGRSDATINRHGIRMGTAELYRAVEVLPEVLDCLVVDLEYLGKPSYMPLFIVLRPGVVLDDGLRQRINDCIRHALTARHLPNDIFAVMDIPKTLSGKRLELPVKKLLLGQPLDKAVNLGSVANPESLAWFIRFATDYLARQAPSTHGQEQGA